MGIETRIVVAFWKQGVSGQTEKSCEETLQGNGNDCIFIGMLVTCMYTFVRTHQTINLKYVHFVGYNYTSVRKTEVSNWGF